MEHAFMAKAYLALTIFLVTLYSQADRGLAASELVKIESVPIFLGKIQQRRAQERDETPKVTAEVINGYLSKPEGNGPFPAVVYLHTCSGLSHRIPALLTSWGMSLWLWTASIVEA
jgi:hypothetical protein